MKENIKEQYNQLTPENMKKVQLVISALIKTPEPQGETDQGRRARYLSIMKMAGISDDDTAAVLARIGL